MNDRRTGNRRDEDSLLLHLKDEIAKGVTALTAINTHIEVCDLRFAIIQKTLYWLIGIVTASTAFLVVTMSNLLMK